MTKLSRHDIQRENVRRRNEDIKARYHELYEQERLRIDDCIKKISWEFYLSEKTVERILTSKEEEPSDPNQTSMFE